MNTSEFKAWFDGFSEAIGRNACPTIDQWKRIQAEVAKLTAETKYIPTTTREPVFPTMPKPWYPDTGTPTWKPGEVICKAGDLQNDGYLSGPAYAYSYAVDTLAKNGTARPEDGLKG